MPEKTPGRPENKKSPSNTELPKRVETPCGLRMSPEEALMHDCFHCRQARAANADKNTESGNYHDKLNSNLLTDF